MAISAKTRKTLWAKSGNRCAICRIELVAERNDFDRNLNIGDECHIISEQPNGPRHLALEIGHYDDSVNLILLCKNHHKEIDELLETYTIERLYFIKASHEIWIKSVIDNASNKAKTNAPRLLPRLTTGKQIADILIHANGCLIDHDELKTEEEARFVSDFCQQIQDSLDWLDDYEIGQRVQFGYDLNGQLNELEQLGFFVFGELRRQKWKNASNPSLEIVKTATILVKRKDNPFIVGGNKILARYQ